MDGEAQATDLDNLRGAADAGSRRKARAGPKRVKALEPSEDQLHRSVAEYLDWMLKEPACWSTFPSGGYLLGKAAAGRLKARGLKAGMPDILVFFDGRCIGIELKTRSGGLSDAQKEMFPKLQAAGIRVHVCRNLGDVTVVLRDSQVPLRGRRD